MTESEPTSDLFVNYGMFESDPSALSWLGKTDSLDATAVLELKVMLGEILAYND